MSGEPSREAVANNLTAGYRILLFDGSDGGPMLTGGIAHALAAAQAAVWEEAAKLAEEESLVPEDEKYDNEVAIQRGQGTYYNMAMTRIAKACRARATAARPAGGRP